MGRITELRIRNFRSICDWVEISFPGTGPLVLIGENNAGKSNIVAGLDLVLGEGWPGNFNPEDHHCFGRDRTAMPMQVSLKVENTEFLGKYPDQVDEITWKYDPEADERICAFDAWTPDGRSIWMNGATRDQLFCMVVGADRRLGYQLSYTSKWTYLSRLMHRFHERLIRDPERVDRLKEHFESLIGVFYEVEEFSGFSDQLRTTARDLGANFQYGLEMDFSAYDPSNFFRSLRVQASSDGFVRTLEELGTGQEQILALAFAYAYASSFGEAESGLILVIEEPEAHLHPLAQVWLGRKIHELAAMGTQIVLTTHSPSFVDLLHLDGLVRVRKDEETGATSTKQQTAASLTAHCRERGASKATATNVLPFYAASATEEITAGLFGRGVIIVEGATERLALPPLLRACGWDPVEHGVAIVAAGGIGSIARWHRLYAAFDLPTYVICDSDSRDDPDGRKRTELLATLSIPQSSYEAALVEGLPIVHLGGLTVLDKDFESAMRAVFPDEYEAREATTAEALGTAKPIVARQASAELALSPDLDGWDEIARLVGKIESTMAGTS